jgi:DNA-3-methyladenine glycosylase II
MPLARRATSPASAIVPVVVPYRLDLTASVLRRLSTNVVDRLTPDGTYVRAFDGFARPAIVSVRQLRDDALEVTLDAPAGEEARALALVERMLGVATDLGPFERRAARIPWLSALARRMRGVMPPRYPTLWEACVNAIVFQQISLFAAAAIMRRLIEALGARVAYGNEHLYAFPQPNLVMDASDATLGRAGLSANKMAALRNVAHALLEGTLDEVALEERSSPEAADVLTSIKGIGPWTAAVVLLRGLGRLDVFPAKDSGVARSVAAITGEPVDVTAALETLGDKRGMLYYLLLLARLEASGEITARSSPRTRRSRARTDPAGRT